MGAQKRNRNQMEGDNNENADCSPPTKKPRKDPNYKQTKIIKHNQKGDVRTFFQLSDFTEKQIKNILQNTKKNINRPLILFADNNWDNYWLQRARHIQEYNTKTGYKHKRQLDDGLDINSKLLSKYDDLEDDNFLSFGIVTYYQNQSSLKNWKNFKSNVNANFLPLKNLIKKNNIKEIIIPSKYPYTKKSGIISHKFNGPGLQIKHLSYIQAKIDQLVKEYIYTDYPVLYGDVFMNHNDLFKTYNKENQRIHPAETVVEIKNDDHEMDEKLPDLPLENNTNEEERIIHATTITLSTQDTQSYDSNHSNQSDHSDDCIHCNDCNDCDNPHHISSQILLNRVREQQIIINDQRIELDFAYRGVHVMDPWIHKINNNHYHNNVYIWIIRLFFVSLLLGLIGVCLRFEKSVMDNYKASVALLRLRINYDVIRYLCLSFICIGIILCSRFKMDTLSFFYISLFGLILFFGWILFPSLATSVSHIIDDEYFVTNNNNNNNMMMMSDDLIDSFVLYFYGIILWCFIVGILSRIISRHDEQRYFIAMSVGGPFMYLLMSLASKIVSVFYGINASMTNEQRLETLWSFICVVLFPFICIAIFIGFVIQWASTSPQLKYFINWKSFGKLILCIIGLYTMIYHVRLTFYAIAIFSFFYIIIQCLTVSGINITYTQHSSTTNNPQTARTTTYNPYSAEWEIQTAPNLY